jgi:hypothetical protein
MGVEGGEAALLWQGKEGEGYYHKTRDSNKV